MGHQSQWLLAGETVFSIDSALDLQELNLNSKSTKMSKQIDLSESDLNESQRKAVRSVIEQYKNIFAEDASEIGCTTF